MANSAAVVLVR